MKNKTVLFIAGLFLLTLVLAGAKSYSEQTETSEDRVVTGTDGNDTIVAGDEDELINGGAGNDKIKDGAGDDYVIGGDGDDIVVLGAGDDYINLGPGDDTLVINMAEDIGKLNYADGGEGNDTVIFVVDDPNDLIESDILEYYEKEKLVGKTIVDMGKFHVGAGLSNFEQVGFAASYTF